MKFFKQFLLIASIFASVGVCAQNRYWVIPPNYVDFYTGQVLPLPNTAISPATTVDFVDLIAGTNSTIPGVPLNKGTAYTYLTQRSSNGIFYKTGQLRYYLNNKAYVTSGKTIVYRSVYGEDLPILPVPNNCDYFFLIKDSNINGGAVALNYKKISLDGSTITDYTVSVPETGYPRSTLYEFAVSPMEHDIVSGIGSYKFYAVGFSYLYEFSVTQSGISFLNSYLHYGYLSTTLISEVELSPNGRYVAWALPVTDTNFAVKVTDLYTGVTYAYITNNSDGDPVSGIEFSASSDKIFFCISNNQTSPTQNKLGYFTLGTGQLNPISPVPEYLLSASDITYIPNTENLSGSYLETAVDGNMYVSDGNSLKGFDPNNPGIGIIKSIPVSNPSTTSGGPIGFPTSTFFTLNDQIDGIDHTKLFQVGCDLTQTYSNVTSSDGSLPVITRVSQNITAQTNVTVMAGTHVTFKAGAQILLQPGFTVTAGGNFNAKLEYCDDFVIDYCNGSGRLANPDNAVVLPEKEEIFVNIFPNPTSGIVNIQTGSGIKLIELETVSLEGVLVDKVMPDSDHETILNLSLQPNGVYIIKIRHSKGVEIRKVSIVK